MTEEQRAQYLADPSKCPMCGCDQLDGGFIEINRHYGSDQVAEQQITCGGCDANWYDIYTLTTTATA